jgi:hypothetical protein
LQVDYPASKMSEKSENSDPEYSSDSKKSPSKVTTDPSPAPMFYGDGDTFAVGGSAELYEPIPEYEGRHRYDPSAEWTEKEEGKLVRRVGLY